LKVLKEGNKLYKMILKYEKYVKDIAISAKMILKDADIYLFGSVINNNTVAGSDIDILIISGVPKNHIIRANICAKIEELAGLPFSHPFHIHLIDYEQFKIWKKIYNIKYKKVNI